MISTFSAINASLYGGSRVSYEIAEDDELPHEFTYILWNQPIGLLITAIATLVVVNTLPLESISSAGSVGFLLVFGMVNWVGFRQARRINGAPYIPLLGFVFCKLALSVLLVHKYQTNVIDLKIAVGIVLGCFLMEFLYKKLEK